MTGLILLTSAGGRAQPTSPAPSDRATNQTLDVSADTTNIPTPGQAEAKLADAPATLVVPTGPAVPPGIKPDSAVAGVAKLAASGVDESVILVYVTNSASKFDLGPDDIVYLNDIGVSGDVITAMLAHDRAPLDMTATPDGTAPAPPTTMMPDSSTNDLAQASVTPPADMLPEQVQPPPDQTTDDSGEVPNPAADYFYDSLAPYGNWIYLGGYGMCWQPTVVVVNSGWSPYVNHGHWMYSDCGWYWMSDYTWGWGPFHYGRWFQHNQLGWCWAPDTVWGPAWVGWKYTDGYCGWAPLPPTACYTPRLGYTYLGHPVGTGFNFFGAGNAGFAFVSMNNLTDHHLPNHLLPANKVAPFFAHSTLTTRMLDGRSGPINMGVPVNLVAAATHAPVPHVAISDTFGAGISRGDFLDRDGHNLLVYRPHLPQPGLAHRAFVGTGVRAPSTGLRAPASSPGHAAGGHGRPIAVNDPLPMYRRTTIAPPHPVEVRSTASVTLSGGATLPATENLSANSFSAHAATHPTSAASPAKPIFIVGAAEPATAGSQQKVIPYVIVRGAPHPDAAPATAPPEVPHPAHIFPAPVPNTSDEQKTVVRSSSGEYEIVNSPAPVQNAPPAPPRAQLPASYYYQMPATQPVQSYSPAAYQAPAYNAGPYRAPSYNPAPTYNPSAAYSAARQAAAPAPRAPVMVNSYTPPSYYSSGYSSPGATSVGRH